MQTIMQYADYIASAGLKSVLSQEIIGGELVLTTDVAQVQSLLSYLQTDSSSLFKVLVDITGVDFPERSPRFDVVYHLLSVKHNRRVRVKLAVDEATPVPSAVPLFQAAGWHERETYDMYGIFFSGNPDLRRILTDYGFDGHPLRKDFPLTGFVEVRYSEEQERVVYEPVQLRQEFRNFDFMSPWEGAEKYVLPGDEKAGEKR